MAADQALPEFELAVGALVVADLHLDVRPGAAPNADFERFVRVARGAPQLLVLGDLFDAWVGPAHAEVDAARRVIELLRDLTRGGTRVDVLAGNRDFLLEQRFERATGARVHPRGCIGRVAHQRLLFLHGDELCTLDLAYQRLKRVLRSGPLAWGLRGRPAAGRAGDCAAPAAGVGPGGGRQAGLGKGATGRRSAARRASVGLHDAGLRPRPRLPRHA